MAKVSLTGKAAYYIGGPTPGRTAWETVDCACLLCSSGRFVALDEVLEEYGQRHILRANLREFHPFGTDAFPPATAYSTIVPKVEKASRRARPRRSSKS